MNPRRAGDREFTKKIDNSDKNLENSGSLRIQQNPLAAAGASWPRLAQAGRGWPRLAQTSKRNLMKPIDFHEISVIWRAQVMAQAGQAGRGWPRLAAAFEVQGPRNSMKSNKIRGSHIPRFPETRAGHVLWP